MRRSPGGAPTTEPSAWRTVVRSAAARFAVLGSSAVLGIVTTHQIVNHFGVDVYAQYGVLISIASLLPFADLGLGAAVMNSIGSSDDPGSSPAVRRVLLSSIRVLCCSAVVLSALAVLLWAVGAYPHIFDKGLLPGQGSTAAMWCLITIAVTLPLGIGQRILVGLHRNHVAIAITALQAPIMVAVVVLAEHAAPGAGAYLPVATYLAILLLSALTTFVALRGLRPISAGIVRSATRLRAEPGERVFDVAWPTLVQQMALPVAMQTDRIVLGHTATIGQLASYNLAAQIFLPIQAVMSAAGIALWPIFARARARGGRPRDSPLAMGVAFGVIAAVVGGALAAFTPLLSDLATDGKIAVSGWLAVSFIALVAVQSMKYPLGMYLTDSAGLKFQALMIVLMVPVNLGLSWWLALRWGAVGPVIGSAVGIGLFQVVANWYYVRHRLRLADAPGPSVPSAPAEIGGAG